VDGSHPQASRCQNGGFHESKGNGSRPKTEVITIGVDLSKNVYQVHGVDGEGGVVALSHKLHSQKSEQQGAVIRRQNSQFSKHRMMRFEAL
jgi:hypothetical protein